MCDSNPSIFISLREPKGKVESFFLKEKVQRSDILLQILLGDALFYSCFLEKRARAQFRSVGK
jgi:hypothetical protein